MRVKFILTILIAWLFSVTYVFSQEGHGHHGHKGSMMGIPAEDASTAVEAGNKVCPVSGQKVGEMGPAVKVERTGKVYNLCCTGCVEIFEKDPEKYSKIAEENAGQEN